MRYLTLILAALVVSSTTISAGDEATKKELKALAGKWQLVGGEEGGNKIPDDRLPKISFVLSAEGSAKVKLQDNEFDIALTVSPRKTPKAMDIDHQSGNDKGLKQYAIYKLEKNRLLVMSTNPGAEETDRPGSFDTGKEKARLMMFERVKEKDKE